MIRLWVVLVMAVSLALWPSLALASCVNQTIFLPGGRILFCTTCCYGGICTTTCS